MNERPTPETDLEHAQFAMGGFTLDFCRKLERERDEAREDLEFRRGLYKVQEEYLEEAREKAERYRLEANALMLQRDEAREALADWENAADHVEANHPDEVHCGCVPVLRKLLADARKERDEAIADYQRVYKERDEAREEIDRYREKNGLIPISWDV